MYDSDSKGTSYLAGFFMLIAFAVAGLLLGSVLSIPVWTGMTGKSIADMEKYMNDPAYGKAVQVMQLVAALCGFLLPAIVTAWLLNRKPFKLLGFTRGINWKQVSLIAGIVITALLVSSFLSYINQAIPVPGTWRSWFDKLENEYMNQVSALVGLNTPLQYIISLLVIAFLPALCEESLFRGGLQNFLTRHTRRPWMSIIIVSVIFSAVHFSYYGFLSRLFLGVILGYLYYYSGSIWANVLAHFLNNALAVTVLYIYSQQGKPIDKAMNDTGGSPLMGVLALPVLIGLLIYFRKISPGPDIEPLKPGREELRDTPFY